MKPLHCQSRGSLSTGKVLRALAVSVVLTTLGLSQAEVIIDDGDPETSSNGSWLASGGTDPYGGSSLYSKDVGASYGYEADIEGPHGVFLWWSAWSSRCTAVPVEIYDDGALLDTVIVNQGENGGAWNYIGSYAFDGPAEVVILCESSACSTCADAVRFLEGIYIDNGDAGTQAG